MKDQQPQIMAQSQILYNHQTHMVWPSYQAENSNITHIPAFTSPPPLPPENLGWGTWEITKSDNKHLNHFTLGSGPGHVFKPGSNPNDPQPKNRRFHHPKKKFAGRTRLAAPFAPRNTTSFIIRAKKAGGIASLVSPCPVTPSILSTPKLSPAREVLVDMAKEAWGVDGYGSMKGFIRLRSGKGEYSDEDSGDDAENCGGCGISDVEDPVEVEKRLNHDLSRFEMVYPNSVSNDVSFGDALENRVDEQDNHIALLEEENLTLKERIFVMESELGELRRRILCLETDSAGGCWRGGVAAEVMGPPNVEDDLAGDVCSESSVGNGNDGDDQYVCVS